MRKLLLLGFVAAGTLLSAGPSSAAYEGPWCVIYNVGFDTSHEQCDMDSFNQCRAEARFWGSTAFCNLNPRYPGNWSQADTPRPRKKRRHSR